MRNKQYLLHVVAAVIVGAAFLCSCAGSPPLAGSATKQPAAAKAAAQTPSTVGGSLASGPFPKEAELSPFARLGLASLSTFELSNGIPVVVRKNSASPVRHISLVIKEMKHAVYKTYGRKGEDIVTMNYQAIDRGGEAEKIDVPAEWAKIDPSPGAHRRFPVSHVPGVQAEGPDVFGVNTFHDVSASIYADDQRSPLRMNSRSQAIVSRPGIPAR